MERTLRDDVKVGAATLAGATLACLVGPASPAALVPAALAIVVATAVLNGVRRHRSRRES